MRQGLEMRSADARDLSLRALSSSGRVESARRCGVRKTSPVVMKGNCRGP